jgi:hypothetical protein
LKVKKEASAIAEFAVHEITRIKRKYRYLSDSVVSEINAPSRIGSPPLLPYSQSRDGYAGKLLAIGYHTCRYGTAGWQPIDDNDAEGERRA